MDHLERLMEVYRAQPTASVFYKLDVLLDIEQFRDVRAVRFLLEVLQDPQEPLEVRVRVIQLLRQVRCDTDARAATGRELSKLLVNSTSPGLRLAAASTLAEFADVAAVAPALGAVALDKSEALDLRYCAFTSIERAGPTPECVVLLRELALDEALGPSARSLLERWQLG